MPTNGRTAATPIWDDSIAAYREHIEFDIRINETCSVLLLRTVAAVSVSGHLDAVLDIRDDSNLATFVSLIKSFRLSSALSSKAIRLGFPLHIIRTVQEFTKVLHMSDCRNWPTLFDVPAASQIFGRIVLDAQVEGILYKSVLTGKPCLALYHRNFGNSLSYVELDDPAPAEVLERRLDSSNCKDTI